MTLYINFLDFCLVETLSHQWPEKSKSVGKDKTLSNFQRVSFWEARQGGKPGRCQPQNPVQL